MPPRRHRLARIQEPLPLLALVPLLLLLVLFLLLLLPLLLLPRFLLLLVVVRN